LLILKEAAAKYALNSLECAGLAALWSGALLVASEADAVGFNDDE